MRNIIIIVLLSFISGFGGAYIFYHYQQPVGPENLPSSPTVDGNPDPGLRYVRETTPKTVSIDMSEDFILASTSSTNSVVYIKNISERSYQRSYLDWFFGGGPNTQVQVSSGSGVIFSPDGYIVTNNHVIADADKVQVDYNKNTYNAKVVGTDPNTDLAVLKIEGDNLPAIKIGSSKSLAVGEWVIAVGNPFNLTSTVTAGIVSAKGREINILQGKFPIESFIQTDAAINPGNSGGALVNKRGELVGINTAILSRTGSYAGYGFAVPVDIVRKVAGDIIKYGEVQKAFIGCDVNDLNKKLADRLNIDVDKNNIQGVLVTYIQPDGAAQSNGIKEGDIVLAIDDVAVDSRSAFEEELSYYSPGDKVKVTYRRNNKDYNVVVTLTNREGTTEILKREIITSKLLGADFETVSKVERDQLGIEYGVRVFNINRGLINDIGIREDFIIVKINSIPIKSPEKLTEILERMRGRVILEGLNHRGRYERFAFYLR